MSAHRSWASVAAGGILLGLVALPVAAQVDQTAARWMAFVGCWEPVGSEGEAGLLCFRPSGAGVEMSNVFEGEVTGVESLVADGVARPVNAEGCTGTESVEFSTDGRRVFTASSFRCEGGEARGGSGVMSFISPTQWIDVRSLTVEGEPVAWVQRYSMASPRSLSEHDAQDPSAPVRSRVRSRQLLAARDILIEDVEEAAARIDPQAVKIWVATHDSEFDLTGDELLRLADSGMPEDVIDVMVAVSFPERFALTPAGVPQDVVDRVAGDAYRGGRRVGFRSFLWDPFYAPIGYRRGFSPFGYYGYSSGFGGGSYGYIGGYYGYVPASIVVVPRDVTRSPSGGRIVNGQGYRGPTASGGSGSSGSGTGAARSSGGSGDSGNSGDSGSSGTSGSSGGGSSTPARRAVPRNDG